MVFRNPLDTDVNRGNVPIGTEWGEEKYAGPKYGWKSNDEYDELLESGALGRGQQTVEMAGKRLLDHGKNIASNVGEAWEENVGGHIPDIEIEPNESLQNTFSLASKILGKGYEWGVKPTVDATLNILDAPATGISWASRKLDPSGRGIGKAPIAVAETALTLGGGTLKNIGKKVLKQGDEAFVAANKILKGNQLQPSYVTVGDDVGNVVDNVSKIADEFTPNTTFKSTTAAKNTRTILGKKSTNEADRRFNRVEHMETRTINTFKKKAGNQYESLAKKLDSSYEHYERTGSLKGMEGGSKWVNEETGEVFLIKNKGAAHERVKLGVDSLESVAATKALREASAKITLDDVIQVAKETGIDEATAVKYFNEASKGKKDLMKLIHGLNKEAGKKLWSLGHKRAVKALRDAGSAHADMLSNIELEPLMNVVDEFGNILVRGNSGRGAVDELPSALNTALNSSRNLREELLKFKDKDLGEFWPKMGPITDEASFLTESAKRDAFVKKVLEVNKKTKDIKVAIDEVLTASGMMKEGVRQPSTFLDASVYENLNIVLD